ncbi:GNAT family N-acetyltransferase [Salinisphaera hydrothermalis]|uniref:GNAT family N-acetyltransferase n=1 Tax=Salinisphaera hydrothermalis TaxID=563188 RepID=UPI003340C080
MPITSLPDDYEISTAPERVDIDVVHGFLAEDSYWARGIPRAVVERAIDHSLCFGVYHQGAAMVGFARVVTDRATFAWLADLFILEGYRGQGLSKALMQHVVDHADLQGLRRLMLVTSDAHGLYRQFGFKGLSDTERFLQVLRSDPYGQARS